MADFQRSVEDATRSVREFTKAWMTLPQEVRDEIARERYKQPEPPLICEWRWK